MLLYACQLKYTCTQTTRGMIKEILRYVKSDLDACFKKSCAYMLKEIYKVLEITCCCVYLIKSNFNWENEINVFFTISFQISEDFDEKDLV